MSARILSMPQGNNKEFHGIEISEHRSENLSEMANRMLTQFYCRDNETPQEAFARTAICFSAGDLDLAQRIYDAVSKGWFMFASPVLSNSILPGEKAKAMPISCFLLDIQDNLDSIIDHSTEVRWLSVKGGGIGANWSKVRSVSNKAPGPMPFLHTIDADMIAYRQGKCYLPTTLVLTDHGWVEFQDLDASMKIGQVFQNGVIKWVEPSEIVVEQHQGKMLRYTDDKDICITVTPDHSMVVYDEFDIPEKVRADELMNHSDKKIAFVDGLNATTLRSAYDGFIPVSELTLYETDYDGFVYCATVPEGRLAVRDSQKFRAIVCGNTRKGSLCAFLDISHPDIIEFINMRVPTGDINRKNLNLHHSVNITDEFMRAVERDEMWDLVDPEDKTVRDTLRARELWEMIIETRYRTGEPNIHFITESNRHLPQPLKDKGLKINSSNLCQEITLPTNEDRTAVCCLSSLNLDKFNEWKETSLVEDMITMLDNVLQFFIENAPNQLAKAKYSASRERSLGLGTMGFHSWLQKNNIAWESEDAGLQNEMIFSHIAQKAEEQTRKLALIKGEYLDGIGSGRRNAHLTAIAPNANSGMLLGVSPSIEPYNANTFTQRSRIGSYLIKNPYLADILEKYGKNNDATWSNIMLNRGSVQHLKFLSEHEKNVYKTAMELDQETLIQHAADRQKYIEQGQSVNLFFPAKMDKARLSKVHYLAWKNKLKTLYYLRTEAENRVEAVSEKVERVALTDYMETSSKKEEDDCLNCQG